MVTLKRLIVVAMVTLHLLPTLETSTGRIYNNMLASLDHTDESRSSFVSSYRPNFDKYKPTFDKYRPTIDKYVKKFTPKQSPEEVRRAKHNKKVHRYDGHLPTPNWHITVHKGIGPAKDKAYEYAYDRWYAFGSHRWSPFVPYPYYHFEIRKGVGIATRETGKILGDFWWDVGNDKWVYGIKQFIGVVTGIVGWYRGTSPFGIISSPVVGYIWASAEHYIERRFFHEDYKNNTIERRKDMHWKLMHPNVFRNATKKPFTSDESYENE